MADWIDVGAPAPEFALQDHQGQEVRLSQFAGRPVILYFYPKDHTPGCTREACGFRDRHDEIEKTGAVILGVSPDGVPSHARFREKYSLNFTLLADPDHQVAEAYGAWREKNMYGKKSLGIARSTYLIDGAGNVARLWKKVSVDGHDAQVLEACRALRA